MRNIKDKTVGLLAVMLGLFTFSQLIRALPTEAQELALGTNIRDFAGVTQWLNSKPLTLKDLHGKVVVIDFYTSGCGNCQAAVPHVVQLYNKYHNRGLVVVGVHTPESTYEKELTTVQSTAQHLGITYPIAVDNEHAVWYSYHNQFWPNLLIFDKEGKLVYEHAGEGFYEEIDRVVNELL
ncbi:MAG: redoxin domain-containing protein [Candidatus Obscuribacterales bacterium]|nr:redoxin domain-containing protein [Candidatus Obscuribacterales bacterium]